MSMADDLQITIDRYHDLLHQSPNDLGLLINLAWSYERSGQFPESIQQFRRALELSPRDYNAHYGLGLALMGNRQHQQALAEMTQARELASESDDRSATVILARQVDSISHRLSTAR
jgi:Flp pilus assembly protein TadD